MKKRTWKRLAAALLICVTIASGPFHASASGVLLEGIGGTNSTSTKSIKSSQSSSKSTTGKDSYTKEELRLMSAIIYCEAVGEPYAGKLAVGIVAMNRVRSSKFPNTLYSVIYQKNQFSPVKSGKLKKMLSAYDKGKFTSSYELDCIKAAKAALNGTTKVTYNNKEIEMKSMLFFSVYMKGSKVKIGHHNFK